MSTTYRTLNAELGYDTVPTPSGFLHTLHAPQGSIRQRVRIALRWLLVLAIMLGIGVSLGAHLDHQLYFGETADAAGVVAQAGTTARWTAQAPQCSNKQTCFIRTFLPIARKASQQTGWPVALLIAQAANETSWTLPSFDGWNWGNAITFTPDDGPTCYGGGTVNGFCNAPTPDIGLKIFTHVASLSFYAQVKTATSDKAAAQALGRSPWAESGYSNGNGPGSSLIAVMDDFNLYQYDK